MSNTVNSTLYIIGFANYMLKAIVNDTDVSLRVEEIGQETFIADYNVYNGLNTNVKLIDERYKAVCKIMGNMHTYNTVDDLEYYHKTIKAMIEVHMLMI